MRLNKKGIEPLIASILLIVVVVGIGAVVTGIVRNFVSENKQTIIEKSSDLKCGTEVQIEIPTVADAYKICKYNIDSTHVGLFFMLQNTGSATINDMQVKVFGMSGFVSNDTIFNTTLALNGFTVGSTTTFNVSYNNATTGVLQEVKIIPRISVAGRTDKAFCTDSGLSFGDLATCT
jgi:hypothetical protein